jgi:autotransporter-associated beta strand protein
MQWDGQSTGPVAAYSNTGSQIAFSGGAWGLKIHLTVNQVNPVSILTSVTTAQSSGFRWSDITLDAGSGAFNFGDSTNLNSLDTLLGGTGGQIHSWLNNSVNAATVYPNVRWRFGGGGTHTFVFDGTGNWNVTNTLKTSNGSTTIVTKQGPGTMTWTEGSIPNDAITGFIGGPLTINEGTLVLRSGGLEPVNAAIVHNGTLLKYDAVTGTTTNQTINGAVSGLGLIQVNNGLLTLSSPNSSFTGNLLLTGGELIVNGAENVGVSGPLGLGGTISFGGGTLGFTVNNVFDYSPRFSTAASQAFSIDTGGQSVVFTNQSGLSSSGGTLTKVGSGTLTLGGTNSYTGLTTVSSGKLVFEGRKTGTGSITVADGQVLGIFATDTQVTPGTLTLGTSGGTILEFDNVNSTTTAPLAAGTLSSAGTLTINVNSGALVPGNDYPLLAWTTGSAPAVNLGLLNGFIGNLFTNGSSIRVHITATAFKWTGNNNNSWDLTTPNNWLQNGGPVVFANGGPALLDDTASSNTDIIITGVLLPTGVTFNNASSNYSVASSAGNVIGGSATLLKANSGTLTLSGGANTYTGVTTISGGTVSVGTLANGGSPSDIGQASSSGANLVLNGGTLQYTGAGASSDHLFTLGTGNGTIDGSGGGALVLNNGGAISYGGNGPRSLDLTGTGVGNTLAAVIGDNGGATALLKNGAGSWILTGNNTYSGVTTINNGQLQIGTGGASGSPGSGSIVNSGSIVVNRTGTLTVNGAISGGGTLTNAGTGTLVLAGNNSYTGVTVNNVATLQIGNAGAAGFSSTAGGIINSNLLIFNSTTPIAMTGFGNVISGPGNVRIQRGFVDVSAGPGNTYTGWTLVDSGATFAPITENHGQLLSSVITNNGTVFFTAQELNPAIRGYSNNIVGTGRVLKENNNANPGWVILAGTNTYTGGTFIAGGAIQIGDGLNIGAGSIVGTVTFTNTATANDNPRTLIFNRPDDFVFTNNIVSVVNVGNAGNRGAVQQDGANTVTLTGNNNYPAGTTINAGTLQIGNGGANVSIGAGTIVNNGALIFNSSSSFNVGAVSGSGPLTKIGSGTVTLTSANNTYLGDTTISNGTLVYGSSVASLGTNTIGGSLNIEGGTLISGGISTVTMVNVGLNMNIDSGTVVATLNKALSPSFSNTTFTVAGALNSSGGTLKLLNAGPTPVVGDKFTIFSQPVVGGAGITIVSPGFSVANNLAGDGSVTVTAVQAPPTLSVTLSGGSLNLTWPSTWTGGVHLQSQTNSVSVGLTTNWVTIPGTDQSNTYTTPLNRSNVSVFYRLIAP